MALVKLADAVINETEKDFALDTAEKVGNGLVDTLWDPDFGGFFVSQSDRYKKPGIQGVAIQAFVALYEATGKSQYRELALDTLNNYDNNTEAWNESEGYYVYVTSHTGFQIEDNPYSTDPYEPQSLRVDHNTLMGNALLDLYQMESNQTYLTKALRIFDNINTTCRNTSTHLFYSGVDSKKEAVVPEESDLFINSLILEFLANLYNTTADTEYYNAFLKILNSVLIHFWDNSYGGFIATSSTVNSSLNDDTKFTERQFYGIRALDEGDKLTDRGVFYNLILDTIEILNNKLYDHENGGYFQICNPDGTQSGDPTWRSKLAITQSLAIYSMANLWLYSKPGALNIIWSPSTPTPLDRVTLLIAAFDPAGISRVFLNYSINKGDYELLEMIPHTVGNMYNVTLEPPHPDGTTIDFNVIINNTLGVQVIRREYSFLWQEDRWPPEVQELGFLPGGEIPVNEEFSVFVSAQDVPSQGTVKYIRFHYSLSEENRKSELLEQVDIHIWKITFPDGLSIPGAYAYYFESIDNNLNPGFSHIGHFIILGEPKAPPFSAVLGLILIFGFAVPVGLYTYVEYKKKSARTTLKEARNVRFKQRGRKLSKRGTRRT